MNAASRRETPRWIAFAIAAVIALGAAASAWPASDRIAAPQSAIGAVQPAARLGKCPPDQRAYTDGASGKVKCVATPPCGPEQTRNAAGACICPPGKVAVRQGNEPNRVQCVATPPCSEGQSRDAATGACRCPPGYSVYFSGAGGASKCVAPRPCPPGIKFDAAAGKCQCPAGTRVYWDGAGAGGCV
jgi:hypothetical protein